MGQWKCASWNMHHTVSISLLKTLHLIQHDIFFSIYWFFSYQYIAVLSFSMWTFYVFKTSAWVSDFLTKKQLYYSFIISKILVYFLFDKPLKFNGKKVCHTKSITLLAFLTTYFADKFVLERDISMLFCGYKHIIITHCYHQ